MALDSSEAQLVTLARSGDQNAFGELAGQYQGPLFGYLYRLTGDTERSKDLLQDTLLQAFRDIGKVKGSLSFKAWLYRIATNNAYDYFRRQRLRSFLPFSTTKDRLRDQRDPMESLDTKMQVQQALLTVPPHLRVCLLLYFVDGYRQREIADMLGMKEDAVRKRVLRGSVAFRSAYGAPEVSDEML